jgi:hypothetical protein
MIEIELKPRDDGREIFVVFDDGAEIGKAVRLGTIQELYQAWCDGRECGVWPTVDQAVAAIERQRNRMTGKIVNLAQYKRELEPRRH